MRTLRNLLLLLLFTTAGCNLSLSSNNTPVTEVFLLPTTRPVTTEEPQQPPPTNQPLPTSSTCTPRADWTVVYGVVSGDTVASIAQRANTTIDALTKGNCLADPNAIAVGQQLRLPQTPISNSLPPTSSAITYVTYTNTLPGLGIALEFPSTWAVMDNPNDLIIQGTNGSAFEILYGPSGQTTPPEQSAAECKTIGACIGSRSVLNEGPITLPSGLTGYRLDLSLGTNTGSTPMSETFMVVNNRNLAVRGFGDLSIYNVILNSLRPYLP